MLKVEIVKTKKDFNDFLKLPWRIYKDDKYWVPPLLLDVKSMFNKQKNPFFQHAEIEIFIAKKENEVVGRIVAIVDKNHNNFQNEKAGFFGFFEVIENFEVAKLLFDTAKEWCFKKDMKILRGPANFSSNDEWGLLIEGFDLPPMVMMTYNPVYYIEFIEKYGFRKEKDLFAYYLSTTIEIPERIKRIVEYVKKKENITVRYLDKKNFNKEIAIIKNIYNSAWQKNWGFVPMTDAEFDYMAEKLKPLVVSELIIFIEVNKEPVGVCIAIPNYNEVLAKLNGKLGPIEIIKFMYYKNKIKDTRLLVLGVKKEFQGKGFNALMMLEVFNSAKRLGYRGGELSWILEDNKLIIKDIESMSGKLYKKYRIYAM